VAPSGEAHQALLHAAGLARLWQAEVVVVHAVGLLEALDDRLVAAHDHLRRIEAVIADRWCAPLRDAGCRFRVVVRDGVPADVLREVAVAEGADLVVVGRRATGPAPGPALGSTSLHLLQLAPGPVLVVPGGWPRPAPLPSHGVVLAVGGATPSRRATDLTVGLASGGGATVTVVHATGDVPRYPLGPPATAGAATGPWRPERDRVRLAALTSAIRSRGVSAQLQIEEGQPTEVVTSIARRVDADLVVVGSAHPSRAPDPLYGSTSRQIVACLDRPALVVPTG
jgi:nucleotide-binding universal stress UspA family protein